MLTPRIALVTALAAVLMVACAPAAVPGAQGASTPSSPQPATVPRVAPRAVRVGMSAMEPWESWRLERDQAPALDLFMLRGEGKAPLVVLIQGSGCFPLFDTFEKDGKTYQTAMVPFWDGAMEMRGRAHFLVVEKRGVRSFGGDLMRQWEWHGGEAGPDQVAPCSEEYHRNVAKPIRVGDLVDAVSAFADEPWVSAVYAIGHSEGADVPRGWPGRSAAIGSARSGSRPEPAPRSTSTSCTTRARAAMRPGSSMPCAAPSRP